MGAGRGGGRRSREPVHQVNARGALRRQPGRSQSRNHKCREQHYAHNRKGLTANARAKEMKKSHWLDKEYSDSRGRVGSNSDMTYFRQSFLVWALLACTGLAQLMAQHSPGRGEAGAAEQLLAHANQARAQAGAGPLAWDPALAAAARKHCERMVAEGSISHQYSGELDVSERASLGGAHFGLIEENIAVGPNPAQIPEGGMHSPV